MGALSTDMTGTSDSSRFSVHNTRVRKMVRDGKRVVEKTIRPNGSLPISLVELNEELAEYRERLLAAGIRMPRVTDSWVEDDCVVCLCEDGGENLVELYETPEVLFHEHPDAVAAAVDILRRAAAAGLSIDPHIKNFVGDSSALLYIDFSPPLIESYISARCSAAGSAEEERILRENFSYFTPEFLPYHFAGDLLNVGQSADRLFPEAHTAFIEAGMLSGVSLESFVSRARSIRALEDLRLQKQIFMI